MQHMWVYVEKKGSVMALQSEKGSWDVFVFIVERTNRTGNLSDVTWAEMVTFIDFFPSLSLANRQGKWNKAPLTGNQIIGLFLDPV